MTCPFCNSAIDDAVLVCKTCRRDVAIPPALVKEHGELVNRRDRLMSDLAEARDKLASRGSSVLRSRH